MQILLIGTKCRQSGKNLNQTTQIWRLSAHFLRQISGKVLQITQEWYEICLFLTCKERQITQEWRTSGSRWRVNDKWFSFLRDLKDNDRQITQNGHCLQREVPSFSRHLAPYSGADHAKETVTKKNIAPLCWWRRKDCHDRNGLSFLRVLGKYSCQKAQKWHLANCPYGHLRVIWWKSAPDHAKRTTRHFNQMFSALFFGCLETRREHEWRRCPRPSAVYGASFGFRSRRSETERADPKLFCRHIDVRSRGYDRLPFCLMSFLPHLRKM